MAKKKDDEDGIKVIARNRRAFHEYEVMDRIECGIALVGTEVKSLRDGHASLEDAYARIEDGEVWLFGSDIPEYLMGNRMNHKPKRPRKLLLHKREIERLIGKTREGGLTLVPLSLYFQDGWVKVEIALARGRLSFDKRQVIAQRDADREIARELSDRLRGRRRRARGSG